MEVQTTTTAAAMKTVFLIINCIMLTIGRCGGPLIMRLYFVRGGNRKWFSSWLETAGWPIILIPLLVNYTRRRGAAASEPFLMKPRLFVAAAVIGTMAGLDDYLYAYGLSKLPVSTASLIDATQLAFTAAFAYLIVKQKFTAYSVNAVVLLSLGAVVLGLHTNGDRPPGESKKEYWLGFFLTVVAAAMSGLILPLVELTYKHAKQALTYNLVLQMQLVMCFFATAFCTVGMIINKDFQAIPKEAKEFELGETKYYVVVVCIAIIWQFIFLGVIGIVFYSSSLLSAIVVTVLIPVTELLAVIFYHENFQAEKGISLFLSLWGFLSYFYGDIKHNKETKKNHDDNSNKGQTSETQLADQNYIP